jgi:predicted AAA+ superfamily ATPase
MIYLDYTRTIQQRLAEECPLIQVILGPRQVGKTTSILQVTQHLEGKVPYHYASADAVFASDWSWIEEQWFIAANLGKGSLLILDEIQKVANWSELIKKLWDENLRTKSGLKIVLLGSSSLALQTGLSESLTGRFELIRAYHWNLLESNAAFGFTLDDFLLFGGYPGTAIYRHDTQRWYRYLKDSIIETVLEKDILQLRRIARPSLFRQVFELLCNYPAAEISLRKLVGQLQDPGAIETVQSYIDILEGAYLVKTLQKFSTNPLQKKSSSPKIMPLAPALCTFASGDTKLDSDAQGRRFELIVGLDLLRLPGEVYYWRQDSHEVDYVLKQGRNVLAIEVKSGRKKSFQGLAKFKEKFPQSQQIMITRENYEKFAMNPLSFLEGYS